MGACSLGVGAGCLTVLLFVANQNIYLITGPLGRGDSLALPHVTHSNICMQTLLCISLSPVETKDDCCRCQTTTIRQKSGCLFENKDNIQHYNIQHYKCNFARKLTEIHTWKECCSCSVQMGYSGMAPTWTKLPMYCNCQLFKLVCIFSFYTSELAENQERPLLPFCFCWCVSRLN